MTPTPLTPTTRVSKDFESPVPKKLNRMMHSTSRLMDGSMDYDYAMPTRQVSTASMQDYFAQCRSMDDSKLAETQREPNLQDEDRTRNNSMEEELRMIRSAGKNLLLTSTQGYLLLRGKTAISKKRPRIS